MQNIFNIKNNLLIKTSQEMDDYLYHDGDDESQFNDSIISPQQSSPSQESSVLDEIKGMISSYLSLLKEGKDSDASSLLLNIYEVATKSNVSKEDIDDQIQDMFLSSAPENFTSERESFGQDWTDQSGVSSFSDTLFRLNQYIKFSLKDSIFSMFNETGIIDFSKSGVGKNRIFSLEKDEDKRKFDFFQWVENAIFKSDTPILKSEGVGAKKMQDDIAAFFSIYPQYLPPEYLRITNTTSSTKIRSSYLKVIGDSSGTPRPLFYYLLRAIVALVDAKNKDLISYCANTTRIIYNKKRTDAKFKEHGETDVSDVIGYTGLAGFSEDLSSDSYVDDILDWREANEEISKNLTDDEVLERIRSELIKDTNTQNIIDNLPGLQSGLRSATSKIATIKNKLIFDMSQKVKNMSQGDRRNLGGRRSDLSLFKEVIIGMMDRYSKSLTAISERIDKSSKEGKDPLDVGLKIDTLNDNLVSFSFNGDEVSLDPLNDSGSFDFKSKIPFQQALDSFSESLPVEEKSSMIDGVHSGDISAIREFINKVSEDYAFAKLFVSGIKKIDDNYNPQKHKNESGGNSQEVYELEMAIRNTFYDYKLDEAGDRVPTWNTVGAMNKPRFKDKINKKKFQETIEDRRRILSSYLSSANGEGIKNISMFQSAVKSFENGTKRVKRGNKDNLLRNSTRNLALESLEGLSDLFRDDNTARSILASVLTNLRADLVMCNLLGMVGKKSFREGRESDIVGSFSDLMDIASDNDKRIIKLYVDLFSVGDGKEVNIRDLKIHCLKNKYSNLSPEYRFALVSYAIETDTIDDALLENTSVGVQRSKALVVRSLNMPRRSSSKKAYSIEDIYKKKVGAVMLSIESLRGF
ncbi:hypothetical protein CMI47_08890 [Candidatus Pacearchaeota archaeon]|nr:hypothetical protein [Candidatus Pacearchaeota archaeon]|tara:strand:- start:483 stop:3068 length:2586 start_codon:yes stop_codon:yes gene_type:complete